MAIHSGRENKDFNKRLTLGCIRTTQDAIEAIDESIEENGAFHTIFVQNNRKSKNSDRVNNIKPGPKIKQISSYTIAQQDNTTFVIPKALLFNR